MKPLNKNNAYRKKGIDKIKSQYCKTRQVNCCPEIRNKTEESSTISSPCSKIESDPKSGCWIPNASKGECGLRLTAERVVGGEVARLGEFPYVALLGYLKYNEIFYLCGGSILNSKYILTAAHCHSSKQPIR
jgi:hypothetical protein